MKLWDLWEKIASSEATHFDSLPFVLSLSLSLSQVWFVVLLFRASCCYMVAQNWRQEVKWRHLFFFLNVMVPSGWTAVLILFILISVSQCAFRCSRPAALLLLSLLLLLLLLIQGSVIACISMAHASNKNNELRFTLICNSITFLSESLHSFLPIARVFVYIVCSVCCATFLPVRMPESEKCSSWKLPSCL